jgi:hypothetical protein
LILEPIRTWEIRISGSTRGERDAAFGLALSFLLYRLGTEP